VWCGIDAGVWLWRYATPVRCLRGLVCLCLCVVSQGVLGCPSICALIVRGRVIPLLPFLPGLGYSPLVPFPSFCLLSALCSGFLSSWKVFPHSHVCGLCDGLFPWGILQVMCGLGAVESSSPCGAARGSVLACGWCLLCCGGLRLVGLHIFSDDQ
jgi:hypothetical protein